MMLHFRERVLFLWRELGLVALVLTGVLIGALFGTLVFLLEPRAEPAKEERSKTCRETAKGGGLSEGTRNLGNGEKRRAAKIRRYRQLARKGQVALRGGSRIGKTRLHVRFFAAGHGDSALFWIPGKHYVLVDAGIGSRVLGDQLLKRRVFPFLKGKGISKLDAFFITHPHFDHVGDPVLLRRRTGFGVVYSNLDGAKYLARRRHVLARSAKGPLKLKTLWRGDQVRFGKLIFEVLHPTRRERRKTNPSLWDQNNRSLVMRVRFGKVSFLMAGDAGYAAERRILFAYKKRRKRRKRGADSARGKGMDTKGMETKGKDPKNAKHRRAPTVRSGLPGLRAQVLKLGHHGTGSTSTAWIRAVRPKYAVATCCFRPQKKELKPSLLMRLSRYGVKMFRTDKHKDIEFVTDGKTLRYTTHISFKHLGRRHREWGRKKGLLP